mmetsp:Transcript_3249/g.7528  ORF Transcript_3249/g.7528 Transcript_3249/m.7528 type:complete len:95 (+) Transcript_3249:43-327(+)
MGLGQMLAWQKCASIVRFWHGTPSNSQDQGWSGSTCHSPYLGYIARQLNVLIVRVVHHTTAEPTVSPSTPFTSILGGTISAPTNCQMCKQLIPK